MEWKSVILVVLLNHLGDCANILAVVPLSFASHFKSFQPLFEEIVEQGYNFTLISTFPLSDRLQAKYKWMDVRMYSIFDADAAVPEMLKQNNLQNFLFCYNFAPKTNENILSSPEIQEFIQSEVKFDLVITELFCTDAFFALGPKFNAPVISFSSQILACTHNWLIGNPFPSSYVPNSFLPLTDQMSLFSRIINSAFSFISVLHYEFITLPKFQNMIEKYFHFEEGNVPHMKELMNNISVSFVNAHYSLGYLKPDLPNVVNVAGIHFTPSKPLPKNIRKFMDGAENGIIYVSLGSIVTPKSMPQIGEIIIDALKAFPQKVIMKWDKELLQHIPDHILIEKWLPQADILNHPNCHLFITHGGYLGLMESLNASVPVLIIPVFGDQFYNKGMVEKFEIGEGIKIQDVPKTLSTKVSEILNNEKYKRNMKKRSLLFRERLNSPLETAMYWIDHVIKHQDTSHLRSASTQLTWFELYSLDVLGILGIIIVLILYILKTFILWIKGILQPKKIEKMRNLKLD